MESFWMCHGTVVETTEDALVLSFYREDQIKVAIALKELCYVGDEESWDPNVEFVNGSKIAFSAVLDSRSYIPEVWKVVAAWILWKPDKAFRIDEWYEHVAPIYRKKAYCLTIFQEKYSGTSAKLSSDCAIKALRFERKAVFHAYKMLTDTNSENDFTFLTGSDNLRCALFYDADDDLWGYLLNTYHNISDFVTFHGEVFAVSQNGAVCPSCSDKEVRSYTHNRLFQKIDLGKRLSGNLSRHTSTNSLYSLPSATISKSVDIEGKTINLSVFESSTTNQKGILLNDLYQSDAQDKGLKKHPSFGNKDLCVENSINWNGTKYSYTNRTDLSCSLASEKQYTLTEKDTKRDLSLHAFFSSERLEPTRHPLFTKELHQEPTKTRFHKPSRIFKNSSTQTVSSGPVLSMVHLIVD